MKDREKGEAELRAKKMLNCEKKKNYKLPVKESVQDAFVSRLGPMMMLMTLKILLIVNFYPSLGWVQWLPVEERSLV